MSKNLNILNVDEISFKKIKKRKKIIYLTKFDDSFKKGKITVATDDKKKKTKIKRIYKGEDISKLKDILGKKAKYLYPDVNLSGEVMGLEFKKKNILFKIMFGIVILLILLLLILGFIIIDNKILANKDKKIVQDLNELREDDINYAIVEINPSILLQIKNNVITDTACLNDDCLKIYKDLDIKNNSLNEGLNILYNKSKEEGIDVKNGIKLSSTNKEIKNLIDNSNVQFINIDKNKEREYFNNILDNKDILSSLDSYIKELHKLLQKDRDYNKLYTCSYNNYNLSCYITEKFEKQLSKEYNLVNLFTIIKNHENLMRVLDKFGIKYKKVGIEGSDLVDVAVRGIYLNDKLYDLSTSACVNCICYRNFYLATFDRDNTLDLRMTVLPFNKFNLYDSTYDEKDVILINDNPNLEVLEGCQSSVTINSDIRD